MNKPFETLINRFAKLEVLHGFFDQAEKEVTDTIGVPICMANCGKCCEHNVVMAWGIEVESIASYLIADDPLLKKVMDRCEGWLTEAVGPVYTVNQLKADIHRLIGKTHQLITGRCPLLDGTQCLIHPVRPVTCRAFGVTTYPRGCNRPPGYGETEDRKAINGGMAGPIVEAVNQFLVECSDNNYDVSVGLLPTMLMSRLRSRKFTGLVDSGKIDPIKLVKHHMTSLSVLVESQFADFTMAGDKALQEVEKKGIPTGPLTYVIK
jgi:Fe-S-cluster containining protein